MSRLAVIVIFDIRVVNPNNFAHCHKIKILCCGGFRRNEISIEDAVRFEINLLNRFIC